MSATEEDEDVLSRATLLGEPRRPRLAQQGGQYAWQVVSFGLAGAYVTYLVVPYTDHYVLVIVLTAGACALVTGLQYALAWAWGRSGHEWFRSVGFMVEIASSIVLYSILFLLQAMFGTTFFGSGPTTSWAFYAVMVAVGIMIVFWLSRRSLAVMLNADALQAAASTTAKPKAKGTADA